DCVDDFSVLLFSGADVQPSCGRVSANVSDQDNIRERLPWYAGFYTANLFCSGSLITDQWVLTAATCFRRRDSSTLTVVLGRTNKTGPNLNEVSRGINQTFCHPLFNVTTSENDICLVQLSSPVEFSDYVSPVCLAAANSIFSNGNFSWTVGIVFGGTEVLNELQVQILENNECQNRSSKPITDNKICTRDNQSREAPCLSSLGPSLRIQNEDLVWIQLGIAVSGVICKSTDFPPVYTRVSRYQEWIRSVTGSSQPGFVIFPSSLDDGVSASTSSPSTLKTTHHRPSEDKHNSHHRPSEDKHT
uniref:Peptidase S1 domain-containing protein n=1 Tax=Tetraodon nigroviridis TaxID=99883 RepID=H3C1I2_TETNG